MIHILLVDSKINHRLEQHDLCRSLCLHSRLVLHHLALIDQ